MSAAQPQGAPHLVRAPGRLELRGGTGELWGMAHAHRSGWTVRTRTMGALASTRLGAYAILAEHAGVLDCRGCGLPVVWRHRAAGRWEHTGSAEVGHLALPPGWPAPVMLDDGPDGGGAA